MGNLYKPTLKSGGESSVYWISYYANGKRVRESTGTDNKRKAENLLKEREGRVATGQPILPQAGKTLYDDARADLKSYYTTYATRVVAEAEHRLKHLDEFFKGFRLANIDEAEVTRYVEHRQQQKAANGTINRELATLNKLMKVAYRHRKLMRLPVIEKVEEPPARSGFVTNEQFEAIRGRLPEELQTAMTVAFTFGWRKQEVLGRQKQHLDLKEGTLRLDPGETKNGEGRVVHLTPELRALLVAQVERVKTLERKHSRVIPWLFPHLSGQHTGERITDPRKSWETACKAAGRPGTMIHDLRRSAVRNLEQAGVPRSVAMRITGHKTENVYRRYAIVSPADLEAAATKLSLQSRSGHVHPARQEKVSAK